MPFGRPTGHPCGRPILQSPPLRGRCRRSRQRGVFGGGGRGMAARFFLDEPPRTALRERHRHPQPSRRAPPSVLPDISPSRGEIDLGRAPKDAAGVARSLTWGGRLTMRRAPKDAAGVARSSTWGGRLAMRRMLDCGEADGHPCGRPILQSPPLRGRCRRSRQRGVFGGGGRGMAARFFLDEPPRPLCANATAIPSRAAAHPPLSCRTSPPQGGRSTWGGRRRMRRA